MYRARLPSIDRTSDVVAAVSRHVQTSGLKVGDRLPSEHEVMDALGIGRSSVREAMRHLQALGVVETRRGTGSFLRRPLSASTMHMPLSFETATRQRDALLQTLDVRRGLEVEAGMLAARRARPDDLAEIAARLEEMERVHLRKGTAGREDLAFHLSIYAATRNPLFGQLLEQMREAFEHFFDKPFERPDFARRSFPFHRELYDAIAAGDADRARERTIAILAIVEEDIREMSQ